MVLIPAVFPPAVAFGPRGQKMAWAVIVSRSTALNPNVTLHFPMSVFLEMSTKT